MKVFPPMFSDVVHSTILTSRLFSVTISDNDFDMICITEKWHKEGDFHNVNASAPAGYKYIEKAHSYGRGGDLTVL
jgi:hypothetical protein